MSKWDSSRNELSAMMTVMTANTRRLTELICTGATGKNANHVVLPLTAVERNYRVTLIHTFISELITNSANTKCLLGLCKHFKITNNGLSEIQFYAFVTC